MHKIEGRSIYVTNYELPEIRIKQQINDDVEFFTQKKSNGPPLEATVLNGPDTFKVILKTIQFLKKSIKSGHRPFKKNITDLT